MLYKRVRGAGRELVLLHGWGMNAAVWEGLAEHLSHSFEVTVLDLPGHGHSSYQPGGADLGGWAQACLDAAPAKAVWIGWSLGGSLALEAAFRARHRVRALVMVTATPRFVQGPGWEHAIPESTLGQFRDTLVRDPAATLARFSALQVRGGERARTVLRDLRGRLAESPPADADALDAGLGFLRDTDQRARLGSLHLPSLWLFGDHDALVPWRCSRTLPTLMPNARTQVIDGAAHAPFLSHFEISTRLLKGFLEALP